MGTSDADRASDLQKSIPSVDSFKVSILNFSTNR